MSTYSNLSLRDQFQVAAFHLNFKIRIKSEAAIFEAFALAIASTSDDVVEDILKKNPNAIIEWAKLRRKGKKHESSKSN